MNSKWSGHTDAQHDGVEVALEEDKQNSHGIKGHSVFAPTGRWQNNKDVNWYNKDKDGDDKEAAAEKRRKELMEVKMREEEEMNKRLGIKPGQTSSSNIGESLLRGSGDQGASLSRASTGANRAPLDPSKSRWNASKPEEDHVDESKISKEDRRAAKKLAKMQVKEERRAERRRRREERGDRRGDSGSDASEEEDRRQSRSHRRADRSGRNDRASRDRDRSNGDRRANDKSRPIDSTRLTGRDDHDKYDDRHGRNDSRWSPRERFHRSKDGGDNRYSRAHRDRSRSPRRSSTPDLERRRRY